MKLQFNLQAPGSKYFHSGQNGFHCGTSFNVSGTWCGTRNGTCKISEFCRTSPPDPFFLLLLLYIIIIKKTRAHKNNTTQNEVVFLRDVKKCPTGSNLLKPTPHIETRIQPVDVLFHYPMVNIDAFAFFVVNT